MSWLKSFLGKDEEQQPVTTPIVAPAVVNDDTTGLPKAAGKKVKLNFKKVPKQVIAAIAAETTGQPIVEENNDRRSTGNKGGLTGIFNQAASPAKPSMHRPKMMGPKP